MELPLAATGMAPHKGLHWVRCQMNPRPDFLFRCLIATGRSFVTAEQAQATRDGSRRAGLHSQTRNS